MVIMAVIPPELNDDLSLEFLNATGEPIKSYTIWSGGTTYTSSNFTQFQTYINGG